jgi:hypothetical protein
MAGSAVNLNFTAGKDAVSSAVEQPHSTILTSRTFLSKLKLGWGKRIHRRSALLQQGEKLLAAVQARLRLRPFSTLSNPAKSDSPAWPR